MLHFSTEVISKTQPFLLPLLTKGEKNTKKHQDYIYAVSTSPNVLIQRPLIPHGFDLNVF